MELYALSYLVIGLVFVGWEVSKSEVVRSNYNFWEIGFIVVCVSICWPFVLAEYIFGHVDER